MTGKKSVYSRDDSASITSTGEFHALEPRAFNIGTLTVKGSGTGSADVKVYGSNMPRADRSDGDGEDLGTASLTANPDEASISFSAGYRYFYLEVDALTDYSIDDWAVHFTGSPADP